MAGAVGLVKATAAESSALKQALKHDRQTPELVAEAEAHPLEADEALYECERGWDVAEPGSWVYKRLRGERRRR